MKDKKSEQLFRFIALMPVIIFLGILTFLKGGLVDDAYIFCRYAENIAAGNGAVFNLGQKVEGFTSPLFTYLTALGVFAGVSAVEMVRGLSFLGAVCTVVLLAFYKGTGKDSPLTYTFAAVICVSSIPFALWASTGMDTTLFALVVTVGALLLERHAAATSVPNMSTAWKPWLFLGSVVWVRPEGLILLLVMFLISFRSLWKQRRTAQPWILLLVGAFPMLLLTAFRVLYFDSWLPNTYYAKMSGGGVTLWLRGLLYLLDAAVLLFPLLAWAAVYVVVSLRRKIPVGPLGLVLSLFAAGIVFEGGDFFPMFRFMVPIIPLLAIMAVRGMFCTFSSLKLRIVAVSLLFVANCIWGMISPSFSHPQMMSNSERFHAEVQYTQMFSAVGKSLKETLGAQHSIGILTIGAIPYQTGWHTIDMLGLTDKRIARNSKSLGSGVAGHEKFDSRYFLDKKPAWVLLHPWIWKNRVPHNVVVSSPYVHNAQKDLLAQERFQKEYRLKWIEIEAGYVAMFKYIGDE